MQYFTFIFLSVKNKLGLLHKENSHEKRSYWQNQSYQASGRKTTIMGKTSWIHLPELPCLPIMGYNDDGLDTDVFGKPLARNQYSVAVPQKAALRILGRTNKKAANWFRQHGFPKPGEFFGFEEEVVQIIGGVTKQKLEDFTPGDHEGSRTCVHCRRTSHSMIGFDDGFTLRNNSLVG